ncbi:hypothetical protein [Nocardia brasiliensis]|uniref:hypothetical protein n=1 Tax=Nocardia brasiliensis TaxID=37326 RepID=UPI0033C9A99A
MLDQEFLEAYHVIRKCLLLKLELPYDLPDLKDPGSIGSHHRAVIDAYTVLAELPGDGDTKYFLGEMILQWLTGIEMYRKYLRDQSAWYREAADMMLTSFRATWEILEHRE